MAIRAGDHIIQLNVTRDELETLAYAMNAWDNLMRTVPRVEDMVSKSDAIRQRRAALRFNERIQSLAKGYGIEVQ